MRENLVELNDRSLGGGHRRSAGGRPHAHYVERDLREVYRRAALLTGADAFEGLRTVWTAWMGAQAQR